MVPPSVSTRSLSPVIPAARRRTELDGVPEWPAENRGSEQADSRTAFKRRIKSRLCLSERQHCVAGRFTPTADVGADPAVLVVGGMPVALFGTGDARRRAGLDRRADQADIGTALPRRDARGRLADVSTVESDADHAGQFRQVALAQAGIGAGGAAGAAIEAFLGAPEQRFAKVASRQRVELHDLAKGHLLEGTPENATAAFRRAARMRRASERSSRWRSVPKDDDSADEVGAAEARHAA
jgi:hypothetical protein